MAREVAGAANVHDMPPLMGAEDFSYMLEARPGAFIFCGNGDSAGLHHPAYDFNDEAIVYGTSYWIKLVENKLRGGVGATQSCKVAAAIVPVGAAHRHLLVRPPPATARRRWRRAASTPASSGQWRRIKLVIPFWAIQSMPNGE